MTDAQVIAEMMEHWNRIKTVAREQFPAATEEDVCRIAWGTMNHSLALLDGYHVFNWGTK